MSNYPTVDYGSLPALAVADSAERLGFTGAPVALADADATLTAAQVLAGSSDASALTADRTLTTPTAADLVAAVQGALVGTSIEHTIVNPSGDDAILALGTGVTLLGAGTVSAGTSGQLRFRFTNVTSGSEACQVQRIA